MKGKEKAKHKEKLIKKRNTRREKKEQKKGCLITKNKVNARTKSEETIYCIAMMKKGLKSLLRKNDGVNSNWNLALLWRLRVN